MKTMLATLPALALALGWAAAQAAETAKAPIVDADGAALGEATLTDTPHGVLLSAQLSGLPSGPHALHIHETGRCEGPDFESAGGHFNPTGRKHGFLDPDGAHAGDLPNIHVGQDGTVTIEHLVPATTLRPGEEGSLLDDDGAAVVVHAGPDDYEAEPAGDSGSRIGCGVIGGS